MRKTAEKTEILVVGAGPIGMFTALRLAQGGRQMHIIEQEPFLAGQTRACALHPASIALLDAAGVATEAIDLGCRVETIRYHQAEDEWKLDLRSLDAKFPFVLALPQSALEFLLERRLQREPGVKFRWRHRLLDLRLEREGVTALVEVPSYDHRGCSRPDSRSVVQKELEIHADYLVGADGHGSVTRQRLGIPIQVTGPVERFAMFEFETTPVLEREMNVIMDDIAESVMWPLDQHHCRWSFQVHAQAFDDFLEKERQQSAWGRSLTQRWQLTRLLSLRAPWFKSRVVQMNWSAEVQFSHCMAAAFQRGHAVLIGDAAHKTGPIGMRSMNAGFREGANLAGKLGDLPNGGENTEVLEAYDRESRNDWKNYENKAKNASASPSVTKLTQRHCGCIAATLPLSGRELDEALGRLGIRADCSAVQQPEIVNGR